MIKIRYADLPEGLHVDVRSANATTVIYLAPALTRAQRRAALSKARQAARVGRSAPLPVVEYAFARCADKTRTTVRAAAAAARVHPVGFAVPAAVVLTAIVLYTFVTSVTIRHTPPQAAGSGPGHGSARGAMSQEPRATRQPMVSGGAGPGGGHGSRAGQPGGSDRRSPSSPTPRPVHSKPRPSSVAPSPSPWPAPTSAHCVAVGPVQVCVQLRAGTA